MIGKRRVTFHLNFKKVHYVKITYVIKFTISRTYLYLLLSVEPLNITWSVHVYLSTVDYRVHGS